MKYQIVYSKTALRDLDRVWNDVFEASKNDNTALKYINELMSKVEAKADNPKSGAPLYYQDLFVGYYFIVFKAYIVFYRVDKDKLYVDRVLFGASDYMRYLHLGAGE